MTSKILFDSKTNFKTISLCVTLSEAAICCDLSPPSEAPGGGHSTTSPLTGLDWIRDFFTVIEYPVVGYVPPAILTEMHFDVRHSTVDALTSASGAASLLPVGRATLALGNVKVNCSLLDTGKDASISVSLEDVGLYLSPTPDSGLTVNLVNDAVCVCDVDLLEVTVNLRDNAGCHGPVTDLPEEELDVCISCNLLRLRTCSDTVVVMAELADHLAKVASNATAQQQSAASRERSREGSAGPPGLATNSFV